VGLHLICNQARKKRVFDSPRGHHKKEKAMSKMSDLLKKALDKKKGVHHPETDDTPVVERKTAKQRAPVIGKKPPTRSAGRGR
jgi:hypothetical protein